MTDSYFNLLLPMVVPSIGFAIWFIKRQLEDARSERRRQAGRENLVRALYAEIDFNTTDMDKFLSEALSRDTLLILFEENGDLIPHITDARHTEIYRNRISEVHSVTDGLLSQIVYFYGLLEKIRVQIDGLNYPSFKTVSALGKTNGVRRIFDTADDALKTGRILLDLMEENYEDLNLQRHKRPIDTPSTKELQKRMRHLAQGLQKFQNTLHDKG